VEKNSSFIFLALAFALGKNKCAVCAAGVQLAGNVSVYGS